MSSEKVTSVTAPVNLDHDTTSHKSKHRTCHAITRRDAHGSHLPRSQIKSQISLPSRDLSLGMRLGILTCALDTSTTHYYSVDASSYFKQHSSVLPTFSIATSIIAAVSKPFIAKISDITSRPYTYLLTLFFYILGYLGISLRLHARVSLHMSLARYLWRSVARVLT